MATIQENLNTLSEIKTNIKTSIINKGVDAGDDITLYGNKIREISGGGGSNNIDYLCFEALEDSVISLSNFKGNTPDIEYSFDKEEWYTWDYYGIELPARTKIYFRGDNPNGFSHSDGTDDGVYSTFSLVGSINIYGNFMTLINANGNVNAVPDNCFNRLFDCQSGTDQVNVIKDCRAILPCETIGKASYRFMFSRNANILHVPALPATTLNQNCYIAYAYGCSSLKEAPYLPAKTLVNSCYVNMFRNCSNLQYIKAEFTTRPSQTYTSNWVSGVAATGCFIKGKTATWTVKDNSSCPAGWVLITSES